MSHFAIIGICLLLGIIFKKLRVLPTNTPSVLNFIVITFCTPALTLEKLRHVDLSGSSVAIGTPWILFVISFIFFMGIKKIFSWQPETTGALIMTSGLGNTSFLGFPLVMALFGSASLATAILVDQPGSFFVLSTLGLITASFLGAKKVGLRPIVLRLIKFPPLLAIMLAMILRWVSPQLFTVPEWVDPCLDLLAAPLIPLALLSVGLQWKLDRPTLAAQWKALTLGLGFKLIFSPALIYFIFVIMGHHSGTPMRVIITEAAMSPMTTAAIIAEEMGLDADMANSMVAVGIPLSLVSAPLWAYLTHSLS
jgi:predicted permease